jgi:hypothetical protein
MSRHGHLPAGHRRYRGRMGTNRPGGQVVDIYASILRPIKPGGNYLVIVSAFSSDPGNALIAHPYKARAASDVSEASSVLARLSAELRNELELWGYQVRSVKRGWAASEAPDAGEAS